MPIGQLVEGEPFLRTYARTRILNKASLHCMPFHQHLSGIIVKVEPHELKTTWFHSFGGELLTYKLRKSQLLTIVLSGDLLQSGEPLQVCAMSANSQNESVYNLHNSELKVSCQDAGVDMEFAPKDIVQPSFCTPITHLYFCPAFWHLGSIGLWCKGGSAASEPAAELSQVSA